MTVRLCAPEFSWPLDAPPLEAVSLTIGPDLQVRSGPAPAGNLVELSDQVFAILLLAARHDAVSPRALVTRLVCHYAEGVGLSVLLDSGDLSAVPEFERAQASRPSRPEHCGGGAAVARQSHKLEVVGSSPTPATSIPPERSDRGGGGNPAVPASAAGPP